MNKIILGGGIGGLSAAHYLQQLKIKPSVTLIEASDRVGGWIKSTKQPDGTILEQGARTLRPKGEAGLNTLELLEDLNLQDAVRPINSFHPGAVNRLVYAKKELHLLPSDLQGLFKQQKFLEKPIVSYLLQDLVEPRKLSPTNDESLYDFTMRRFGKEFSDYLISPMVCGICGGNAKELSVHFLMGVPFRHEQKHGGVIKGLIMNALKNAVRNLFIKKKINKNDGVIHKRAIEEKWAIYSFNEGIEQLPRTLQEKVLMQGCDIRLNSECVRIDFNDDIMVTLKNGEVLKAHHLISALPASKMVGLVSHEHPELADLFKKIKSVSMAVVNLTFSTKGLIKNEGFGFLVAPKEKLPILGVIYDSCCFPSGDKTVLTVMLGGYWFQDLFGDNPSDDLLLSTALTQIGNILNINEKPESYKVHVLRECIPQYTVGHKANVERIRDYIKYKELKMSICGNSYDGVGVNDVILSARKIVNEL